MGTSKRTYILLVQREHDGSLRKVSIPLSYAYIFLAAAGIGMFTIAGMAGSYSRMLIKTARFNQLRTDHNALQHDYAQLESQVRQRDIQAASLGSLATEISALYGLTSNKLAGVHLSYVSKPVDPQRKDIPVADTSGQSYTSSLDAFYALRSNALTGISGASTPVSIEREEVSSPISRDFGGSSAGSRIPSLWPISGPITSSFGQREDPILGNGEGEFHPGIDISSPLGTPIHATADGVVTSAGPVNGYGRLVAIDHGHGLTTMYGHMSGFAVTAGQTVACGQVIGYVGHSGRTTGNHVHYEVRIAGAAVNPHRYLRVTLAQLDQAP